MGGKPRMDGTTRLYRIIRQTHPNEAPLLTNILFVNVKKLRIEKIAYFESINRPIYQPATTTIRGIR